MTSGRRAGVGRLADGRVITWSLADGRRGRRWRAATTDSNGALDSILLLELRPDGTLSKVELGTVDGLLTLHPEATGLHGNVVRVDGVRHLRLDWSHAHVLVIEGSAVTLAAAAAHAAPGGVGEWRTVPAVVVRSHLMVETGQVAFERLARTSIGSDLGGHRQAIELDELGIPAELRSGGDWPLELD